MLRSLLQLGMVLLTTSGLPAQYFEVGAQASVWHYRGDIPTRHMDLDKFLPGYGFWTRYNASPWISFRVSFSQGSVTAYDPVHNVQGMPMYSRNLRFRTDITELAMTYEWHITGLEPRAGKPLSPYLFVGLAGFHFNPRAELHGQWVDLQPLGTEGQIMYHGRGYRQFQLAIPMGLGFRWALSPRWKIGVEWGARKTFTDYLDDVSGAYPDMAALYAFNPMAARLSDRSYEVAHSSSAGHKDGMRGNPRNMDWYFQHSIQVSYALGRRSATEFDPRMKVFLD
jgi:hypothetical protein